MREYQAMMRILLLTGPPAAGKTTIGRMSAAGVPRGAFVDGDDVRHLVVGGHAAPWEGVEGASQRRLGVANCCALAGNLAAAGFETVIADVLTEHTAAQYRELLPGVVILQFTVDLEEALRRARTRPVHLTDDEFRVLHTRQAEFAAADGRLDVTALSATRAAARTWEWWNGAASA
jgi:gluconate kinase